MSPNTPNQFQLTAWLFLSATIIVLGLEYGAKDEAEKLYAGS